MAECLGEEGGYEYEFLDSSLASDCECAICHYVTRDPHQAECCGATYCNPCIQRSRRSLVAPSSECPGCRAPSFVLIRDKARRQRANKLRIKCSHCEWTGELGDAETHAAQKHPHLAGTPRSGDTAHAHTHDWSFRGDGDDEDAGNEHEPLIELKQLSAADEEADGVRLRDDSPEPTTSSAKRCIPCPTRR